MKLISILNEDLIFCGIEGNSREDVYRKMLRRSVEKLNLEIDVDSVLKGIIEREDMTMIPYEGMAIPHLRIPGINDLYVIVGLLKEPVMLKDNDLKPTRVIVMSLISENTSDVYLKSLAAFTRFFSKPENIDQVVSTATSEKFLETLNGVKLKKDITAEDIMKADFPAVKADDSLSAALDIFNKESKTVLPVVDAENRLVGQIEATDVIKKFIPEYILMMDNLKFISSFEMFEEIFKTEESRLVRDYMTPAAEIIQPEVPLIQFTVKLARKEARVIFVTDSEQKLLGAISIRNIIHKILRG
jgi:PTS system nitrogen regulatory IIA component